MRTLFLLLTTFASLGTLDAQRTPNDTIDFNNFDTTLFVQCFVDLCNQERVDYGIKNLVVSKEGTAAAKYQASYVTTTRLLEHNQTVTFKGKNLKTPKERLDFFYENQEFSYVGEILSGNCILKKVTYKFLAKQTFRMYIMSEGHKNIIMANVSEVSPGIGFSKESSKIQFYTCFLLFENKKAAN